MGRTFEFSVFRDGTVLGDNGEAWQPLRVRWECDHCGVSLVANIGDMGRGEIAYRNDVREAEDALIALYNQAIDLCNFRTCPWDTCKVGEMG